MKTEKSEVTPSVYSHSPMDNINTSQYPEGTQQGQSINDGYSENISSTTDVSMYNKCICC